MLNVNGTFNQCDLPNECLPPLSPFTFASVLSFLIIYEFQNGRHFGGSLIGSMKEALLC